MESDMWLCVVCWQLQPIVLILSLVYPGRNDLHGYCSQCVHLLRCAQLLRHLSSSAAQVQLAVSCVYHFWWIAAFRIGFLTLSTYCNCYVRLCVAFYWSHILCFMTGAGGRKVKLMMLKNWSQCESLTCRRISSASEHSGSWYKEMHIFVLMFELRVSVIICLVRVLWQQAMLLFVASCWWLRPYWARTSMATSSRFTCCTWPSITSLSRGLFTLSPGMVSIALYVIDLLVRVWY